MSTLYNILKFLVGFVLAITLMAGASIAAALYFAVKLTTNPARPTFPNDKPLVKNAVNKTQLTQAKNPVNSDLPPGAYKAIVTEPIGLILRDKADDNADRIGGIGYNEEIIILEDTSDGKWQKVRLIESKQEGWIKGGNTERMTS